MTHSKVIIGLVQPICAIRVIIIFINKTGIIPLPLTPTPCSISGDGTDSDAVGLNPDNPGQNLIIDGLHPNGSGGSSMKQGVVSGTCLLLSAAVLVFQ